MKHLKQIVNKKIAFIYISGRKMVVKTDVFSSFFKGGRQKSITWILLKELILLSRTNFICFITAGNPYFDQ